jgi:hypothetical protein
MSNGVVCLRVSSGMGNALASSRKYFNTVIPRWVISKTMRSFSIVRFSIRSFFIRKSMYSLSTLQFMLALYMICVNFNGPRWPKTLRMSMYISSFDRLILSTSPSFNHIYLHVIRQNVINIAILMLFNSGNFAFN